MRLTTEKIEIMQAFVDGAEIEIRVGSGWEHLYCAPSWNWVTYEYRVKKETQTPFDINDIDKLRGKWIKDNEFAGEWLIIGIDSDGVYIYNDEVNYKELITDCLILINGKWLPCCKESLELL